MIQHHLDNATLVGYASGGLDEAFTVAVAAHLAMCADCRHGVAVAEEIGGQVLASGDDAEMSPGSFERLMRSIDERDCGVARASDGRMRSMAKEGDVPQPLRRFIGANLADVPWKAITPSVKKHAITLSPATSSSLYLLQIAPGKKIPEHGHDGAELTLVLSGAYRDELGRFGPGDIADLDEHVEHQPQVEADAPCICLVATEGPTRFKGVFGRLIQPILRI